MFEYTNAQKAYQDNLKASGPVLMAKKRDFEKTLKAKVMLTPN